MARIAQKKQVQLQVLRQQIAKAAGFSLRTEESVPLGISEIDAYLNGGLLRGALHEITAADHRSQPAALGFLLALTAISACTQRIGNSKNSLSPIGEEGWGEGAVRKQKTEIRNQKHAASIFDFRLPISDIRTPPHPDPLPQWGRGKSCVLWPLAKHASVFGLPYPPGLKFFGIDPSRILFVHCASERDCLWAMEEGLRLGGIAGVIGARAKTMDLTASRRLQLAAEQANTPVFLLRNYNDKAPSAAVTRWRIASAPSARDQFGFYKNPCFRVALDYARGGKTGEWVVEWTHDALSLRLSSVLGDRAAGEDRAA